ncbi:MAG: hypothetical protein QMD00_03850 [Hadesarchaea archaeon]|nr:hypothetical protein [Hadesarchaea archaeon]
MARLTINKIIVPSARQNFENKAREAKDDELLLWWADSLGDRPRRTGASM